MANQKNHSKPLRDIGLGLYLEFLCQKLKIDLDTSHVKTNAVQNMSSADRLCEKLQHWSIYLLIHHGE